MIAGLIFLARKDPGMSSMHISKSSWSFSKKHQTLFQILFIKKEMSPVPISSLVQIDTLPWGTKGGFSNRFTIAVIFGATSSTCLDIFLRPKDGIFQMADPAGWVQEFAAVLWLLRPRGHPPPADIVTVLVYGILFYPIFACLTTDNRLVGSLLGFLYVTISLINPFSPKSNQHVTFNKSNMILPQSIALLIIEMMPTMFKTKVNLQGAAKWLCPHKEYQKELFYLEYLGLVPINLCLAFIWMKFGLLLYREVRKKCFPSGSWGGEEIRNKRLASEIEIAHMTELLNPGSIS
ncbi:hypothetical protein pdam_00024682 [Pocillopora damicornis]|uniref:Uncharacterized protein n=1 Tax=Pocillopora damicornis TaxID=46731 RepID=A0A3M6URM6_POCDA|nr:hypothetical protein pdam_00024682 [Pocillopora damicornis]